MTVGEIGELLGSGRTADVFALGGETGGEWVLRRYRDGSDTAGEAALMAYVAGHGYPVPEVRAGKEAPSDLVMRRVHGPTMLGALLDGEVTAAEGGAALAGLLHALHAIPARVSRDPGHRVLHLDLHPDNVMLTPDGPVVIDWRNAEEGPPGLDWAMSAVILAQVAVSAADVAAPAGETLEAMLAHRDPALDLGDAGTGPLADAGARRAANPTMSVTEIELLGDAVDLILELLAGQAGRISGDHQGPVGP
jgi:aminoglycoside phosphotransferase (APT) family kinase protein